MPREKVPAIGEDVSFLMPVASHEPTNDVSALMSLPDMAPMPSHARMTHTARQVAFGPGAIPNSVDVRPVADAYMDYGPREVAGGVQDIASGDVAKGGRRVIAGGTMTAAPLAAPLAAHAAVVAPMATALGLAGGVAAKEGTEYAASQLGATEDQAGLAGDIAGIAGGAAAAKFGPAATEVVTQRLPTRANAGAKFQQVMGAVGDKPVDLARAGDAALRVSELAERGGSMPKVVRDFLRRATDPSKPDPTYREMRDFYSNISRLSADETKRLTPVVRKQLGELRSALNEALADVAAKGGHDRTYRTAMRQYAIASKLRGMVEKGLKLGAAGAGATGAYAAYNALKD
jgi:hypothetical protein